MSANSAAGPFAEFETLVLERTKVAARTHLSAQMAHDFRARTFLDRHLNQMVVELRSYVHQHKVDQQDVSVPFSKTETREIPAPRLVVPAFAALALLATGLGAATASLAWFALAAAVALAGVVVHASNPPQTLVVTAAGVAVVHRTLFNQFPDNTVVYPEEWGSPVLVPQQRSYIDWDDPSPYADEG